MSATCRPCVPLVPDPPCPSDFSGGTVNPPIPTRQRVCNTEQSASCPDGSNPQIIPAGTFCTTILNPTTASVATAQMAMDNQALAQAQSQVGDCAWNDIVWECFPNDIAGTPVGVITTCAGNAGNCSVSAFSPSQTHANAGTYGVYLRGRISFNYKNGTTTHHNMSGTIINSKTGVGGLGVLRSELEVREGANYGALGAPFISEIHDFIPGLGTFPFSHNFTDDGVRPRVYQFDIFTSVWCEEPVAGQPITHTQNSDGVIVALD